MVDGDKFILEVIRNLDIGFEKKEDELCLYF
jgi:hypothetical protein